MKRRCLDSSLLHLRTLSNSSFTDLGIIQIKELDTVAHNAVVRCQRLPDFCFHSITLQTQKSNCFPNISTGPYRDSSNTTGPIWNSCCLLTQQVMLIPFFQVFRPKPLDLFSPSFSHSHLIFSESGNPFKFIFKNKEFSHFSHLHCYLPDELLSFPA